MALFAVLARMLWSVLDACKSRRVTGRQLTFTGLVVLVLLTLHYSAFPHYAVTSERWIPDTYEGSSTPPEEWKQRAEQVKQAFRHAYGGYERYAMPHDELRPLSNSIKDNFNGWGVSLFDSLDTMILMGLNDEFARALPIVEQADFIPSPVSNQCLVYIC